MIIIKTYGRTTIYANYTEKQLLTGTQEQIEKKVIDIMTSAIPIHEMNRSETKYLWEYYSGKQDIYTEKQKLTRTDIDNRTVENWAYAFIDFKKAYLLGKPIQYVQNDSKSTEEIAILNKFVKFENKKSKDMDLYEDILVNGRGFRYTASDKPEEEDEAPFELINCSPEDTEVVYSSKLGNEQLLSFIETSMQHLVQTVNPETGETEYVPRYYSEYTIYLKKNSLVLTNKSGQLEVVKGSWKPVLVEEHTITEYYVNRKRISLIEIGKDLFNDINYLESLDKDDMEAYVNNLLVFINCEATEEDLKDMAELGAVNIASHDQKRASIESIQQRLSSDDTQTYYTRLLTSLHQILGVPMASNMGNIESGDTGKAQLTGQGYTSATIRIENDETKFGDCDKNCLKAILKICKNNNKSGIKNLRVSEIDSKFQRDVSDNLLVKTQGLMNLLESKIPKEYALSIVNLFSDVEAVVKQMKVEEKEREQKQEEFMKNKDSQFNNVGEKNKADAQNNKIQNVTQKQNQGQ